MTDPVKPAEPIEPAAPAEPKVDEPAPPNNDAPEALPADQVTAIDDMLQGVGLAPKPAPAATAAPANEPKPGEPAPAEPTTEPAATSVETEADRLKKAEEDVAALRQLIAEMSGGSQPAVSAPAPSPAATPASAPPSPPASVPPAAAPSAEGGQRGAQDLLAMLGVSPDFLKTFSEKMKQDQKFLSDEELDKIIDDPSLIHKAMNEARRKTAEEILPAIPAIATMIVSQYMEANRRANDFYEANEDLAPYRDFIAVVYRGVREQNPNDTQEALFSKTATEARKRLRLSEPKPTPKVPGVKPAFAKPKGGARRGEVSSSADRSQQDYMVDMLGSGG